jgi:hypothetical protein
LVFWENIGTLAEVICHRRKLVMQFGTKVGFAGPRLWFHDPDDHPLFGLLAADIRRVCESGGQRSLDISAMVPVLGWQRLTLQKADLYQLKTLWPSVSAELAASRPDLLQPPSSQIAHPELITQDS